MVLSSYCVCVLFCHLTVAFVRAKAQALEVVGENDYTL